MATLVPLFIVTVLYAFLVQSLPTGSLDRWQAIAFFNFGLLILLYLGNRRWKIFAPPKYGTKNLACLGWALPFLVSLGSLGLVYFSARSDGTESYSLSDGLLLCLVIPLIEELIFRRFLSSWLSQKFPRSWTLYLSALIFALAHSSPPVIWPPLGPFLLGLAATFCYQATGRIAAPILLHAACNASAILFTLYAPVWLEQLSWLYQKL